MRIKCPKNRSLGTPNRYIRLPPSLWGFRDFVACVSERGDYEVVWRGVYPGPDVSDVTGGGATVSKACVGTARCDGCDNVQTGFLSSYINVSNVTGGLRVLYCHHVRVP